MTIIQTGSGFHVEFHRVIVALVNAAGFSFIDTPVDKAGRLLGFSATSSEVDSNDNTQAIGNMSLSAVFFQGGGSQTPTFGRQFDTFRIFVDKQAGTAGATNFEVVVMLWIQD